METKNLIIRHSKNEDLPQIMAIYARAREFMAANGNPRQWGATNWPPEYLIREDIAANRSYVCVEEAAPDKILGTFLYMYGKNVEETYNVIEEGAWSDISTYGVVHRIASDGTRGIGSYCLRWAIGQSGCLRIDTHPDNHVMQSLLGKLGFQKKGIIHVVEDNDPRYAYEIVS